MRDLPPRAQAYVVAVVLTAAVCVSVASAGFQGSVGNLLAFTLLYGLATRFATLTARGMTVSVGFIVALASVAVIGPRGAALIGLAGALNPIDGTAQLAKRTFNAAQFALAALAAGIAFTLVLGSDPAHLVLSHAPIGRVLLAAIVAGFVHYLGTGSFSFSEI
jgi:hypothetical protein